MDIPRKAFLSAVLLASCFPSQEDGDSGPAFRQPADTTILSETRMLLHLRGSDTLRVFEAAELPVGANLYEAEVAWTPGWGQVGEHAFRILVGNPNRPGHKDTIAFKVKVIPHTLVRNKPIDTTILAGQRLQNSFFFWTPEGDSVAGASDALPPGSSLQGPQFVWTPEAGTSGTFRIVGTLTNRKEPLVQDTFSFRVTVLADAPENCLRDTSDGVARIGDFSPLRVGARWVYDFSFNSNDSWSLTSIAEEGTYEARIEAQDSSHRFTLRVVKITHHTKQTRGDTVRYSDTTSQTLLCSTANGCPGFSLGQPLPFLSQGGALIHFEQPAYLRKEFWKGFAVYAREISEANLLRTKHVSNVGLVFYSQTILLSGRGSGHQVTLREFHP